MNQASQQLANGIEQYFIPRVENEIDLVSEVRQILVNAGLANILNETFDNHHFVKEAINKPSHVQRYFMNRYWSLQLMTVPSKSIEQRYCLIPNGEIKDWLRLFNQAIVPFLIGNNLPVKI
jgi:hypothetical protein